MSHILKIDDSDLAGGLRLVSAFGLDRFGYVVTPNTDHVIRHYHDAEFRALYAQASYVFLDSRFLAYALVLVKRRIFRVCLGSDLTAEVLDKIVRPFDAAILVGGTSDQADFLRERFGLKALAHVNPPMNFICDPVAVESCLQSIEASSPFRFCFLAIGSPQQEIIAQKLKERGRARGLALCVGTAINYLTGAERRAPRIVQYLGFEWMFRLIRNPRLANRYLVRGPRIFPLLWRVEFVLRPPMGSASESLDNSCATITSALAGSTEQIS
jgi:N-acetylglucosaminyldiphosphoundecaprenol N-acetyl-beta-D-mannosaminyltransferase